MLCMPSTQTEYYILVANLSEYKPALSYLQAGSPEKLSAMFLEKLHNMLPLCAFMQK